MTWTKGQSGNPGGRPKEVAEIRELARQFSATAIETLAAIADNDAAPYAARVAACNSLLDRGYGRPGTSVEVSTTDGIGNVAAFLATVGRISDGSAARLIEDTPDQMPATQHNARENGK